MINKLVFISSLILVSCGKKAETINPIIAPISESIYASGLVKSQNQYQAFPSVNGIIQDVLLQEGDTVQKGMAILTIVNDAQRLSKENAELAANFADINVNQGKLNEAQQNIELAQRKWKNDSSLLARQQLLWQQNIGSKIELEQRELAFQNAQSARLCLRQGASI